MVNSCGISTKIMYFYICGACVAYGIDLTEVMATNTTHTKRRKKGMLCRSDNSDFTTIKVRLNMAEIFSLTLQDSHTSFCEPYNQCVTTGGEAWGVETPSYMLNSGISGSRPLARCRTFAGSIYLDL